MSTAISTADILAGVLCRSYVSVSNMVAAQNQSGSLQPDPIGFDPSLPQTLPQSPAGHTLAKGEGLQRSV